MRPGSCSIGLGVAVSLQMAATALAENPCQLTAMGTAQVAAVRDGRTLALSDGRELRLAAIEAGEESHAALQTLAEGASVRLARLGPAQDRYGRVVAFAFAGDATQSLQEALLEQGQARVSARVGEKACADGLLALERGARATRRGLWANPNFAPLAADNLLRLRAEGGRFVLVEGKVLSVRESGARIYLNFGRRWTRDFSVILLRRHKPAFTAAGFDPKTLEGRRMRVRGWLEQRAGPVIEASAPEQIEFIE